MVERTDKIALIIAAVLVVILAAGAGALVWKRADTLARENPASAEESVTLAPIESPEVVPASDTSGTAKTPAKRGIPKQPKGAEIALITDVKRSSSGYSITYDPAALLLGKEADIEAKSEGLPGALDGYYIANDTHKLRTARLNSKAVILVAADGDGTTTTTMTPTAFREAVTGRPGDPVLRKAWYWVFLSNKRIVRVEQLLLP